MNKRLVRVIAIVLALIIAGSVVFSILSTLSAGASVTQSQIDKLREERREIQRRRQEVQSRINAIEFEKLTEIAKKQVLDDRIIYTGYEIENISEMIEDYALLIEEKEVEVVVARENEQTHLLTYKGRVRSIEENGVISYLEILFNSSSFSDLLARIDFVGDIMKADEAMYYNLVAARSATEAAVRALELAKEEMEEEKAELEAKEAELLILIDEASAIIEKLNADIDTESQLHRQMAEEEERVQRQIAESVEQLRRQEAAARQRSVTGTGRYIWPVPSSSNVTSTFGTRMHPVHKVMRQHNGIDIGARHGANVIAADKGTVVTSTYNSSYGHYIVISHGSGATTLYAHLSSRRVSEGQAVEQGQVIGLIGSTGVSTGPHLHFEISVNGVRQDPQKHYR